jgi:hypothetical protein
MGVDVEEAAIDHDGLAGDVAAVIGGGVLDLPSKIYPVITMT